MAHADYSNAISKDRVEMLETLLISFDALSSDTTNWVANLANLSSLIWHGYRNLGVDLNWAGFYVKNPETENELILGPFQGKVACQTIQFGRGVCGTAVSEAQTQVVPDVEKFPGHIACDGDTKSEIVVPLLKDDEVIGVLDIDCLTLQGFDSVDKEYLEKVAQLVIDRCKF